MPETPYHHGNLRLALLEAARLLALEQPIDNITLREVARRAGVSHAAPYHHFADKRALLKALALEAFKELLRIQQAQVQPDPNATLYNIGLAYVRFALAHPTEFGFMFRKSLCEPVGVYDELTEVANQCFDVLLQAVAAVNATKNIGNENLQGQGLVCWSAIHGLATLLIEAPVLPTPPTSEQLEGLMQLHSHTLNFGLFALNKA
jgi:AcrR family transcriptional regulator